MFTYFALLCLLFFIQRFCDGFVTSHGRLDRHFSEPYQWPEGAFTGINNRDALMIPRWSFPSSSGDYFRDDSLNESRLIPWTAGLVCLSSSCLLVTLVSLMHTATMEVSLPDVRYFVAGGVCAAASHGLTVPLDFIKTRIQVSPNEYDGFWHATKTIISNEGGAVLHRGIGPTVVGYGIEGAAKFGLYESLKPVMTDFLHTDSTTLPYFFASMFAGATASLVLCPLERVRIRLVTDDLLRKETFVSGLLSLVRQEGIGPVFFGGISAMLSKQVPYTVGKQVSFDLIAAFLYSALVSMELHVDPVNVTILAAFGASLVACVLSQPGDVLLTETYQDTKRGMMTTSLFQTARSIWVQQGPYGFLSGLSARFLHVVSVIQIQLVLYDTTKHMLGLPGTGST